MKKLYSTQAFKDLDFLSSKNSRLLRILAEYIYPLSLLKKIQIKDSIVFFGSARIFPEKKFKFSKLKPLSKKREDANLKHYSNYFTKAYELSYRLALWTKDYEKKTKRKCCIITGGGPGIMEAVNYGAYIGKTDSIGFNIKLPFEPVSNPYIPKSLAIDFRYFFMRKFWFLYHARIAIVFPGGFGTLDELFETLTLQQTKSIRNHIVLLLFDSIFWKKLIDFDFLLSTGMVSKEDMKLIRFVDTIDEAFIAVTENLMTSYSKNKSNS